MTLLTPQGKLKAVARGGVKGSLSSSLSLFHHVNAQVYQGPNNELAIIRQAVLEGALPTLAQPERYAYAHLMAEFADALFQEGELSHQAFALFAASLRGIAHQQDSEWVALVMSYKLLGLAGFILQTNACIRCRNPDPQYPDPHGGQLLCHNCARSRAYPPESLDFLQQVVRRSVRQNIEHPLPIAQRPAVWQALERFVTIQVGNVKSWRQCLTTSHDLQKTMS